MFCGSYSCSWKVLVVKPTPGGRGGPTRIFLGGGGGGGGGDLALGGGVAAMGGLRFFFFRKKKRGGLVVGAMDLCSSRFPRWQPVSSPASSTRETICFERVFFVFCFRGHSKIKTKKHRFVWCVFMGKNKGGGTQAVHFH